MTWHDKYNFYNKCTYIHENVFTYMECMRQFIFKKKYFTPLYNVNQILHLAWIL